METILITGGAGYIGSHAVKLMLDNNYHVVVFDNLYRGYQEAIDILTDYSNKTQKGKLTFFKGDLTNKKDLEKCFSENQIEGVMHFAALCLVGESMQIPEKYFENNVIGSLNLFEVMKANNVNKIIFSSTCATYGESQYLPLDEKHPQNPTNPYGESKLLVEKILKWFNQIHKTNYIILRYFNICGADSNGMIGDSKKPSQLLLQNAVRGAMGIEKFYLTCPTVDTPDGTPIRDYIDVEDLVKAHLLAYQKLEEIKGGDTFNEIINLGNGKGWSVKEIVSEVEKTFNIKIEATKGETRPGEYAHVYADNTKAREILKWSPKKSLKDSIESLKKWYEKYPNGYKY